MLRPQRVLVFTPSFNDHAGLAEIARSVEALGQDYRLLIIDDGSTVPADPDNLGRSTLHVRVPDNFGLGVCTHIAFDHALAHGYDTVVRVDADGQHPVEDVPRLVKPLQEKRADLVAGCRINHLQGRVGVSVWIRWFVKTYFARMASLVTRGKSPRDVNTGFFAANRDAVACLSRFYLERFPEPQIFIIACREGLRVAEVLVEQKPRKQGRSTLNFVHGARLLYRFNLLVLAEFLKLRP